MTQSILENIFLCMLAVQLTSIIYLLQCIEWSEMQYVFCQLMWSVVCRWSRVTVALDFFGTHIFCTVLSPNIYTLSIVYER